MPSNPGSGDESLPVGEIGGDDGARGEGDRVLEVQEGRARSQDRVSLLSRREPSRREHALSQTRPGRCQGQRRQRGRGARGDLVRHQGERGERVGMYGDQRYYLRILAGL